MKKHFILDTRRSCLTTKEIHQFKDEITKQKNSPICENMSTMEVSRTGAEYMAADGFHLVKGQLDV